MLLSLRTPVFSVCLCPLLYVYGIAWAGDRLDEDDVIAQIETDKVTIDVRYTGSDPAKVVEILVKEQDTVEVGQPVVKVE